jgi:N-acetylmuramoyl-L-alanine amidase
MAAYKSVVISSGHGKYVRGASGVLDEVDEARRVADALGVELGKNDVLVKVYHDDVSKTQNENLNRIVDYHNSQGRELDVSIHFNAFEPTDSPRGTEVLYVTQDELAKDLSAAIASCGFIDRGPKYRDDLFFLNNTARPAVLIEVCFVDSNADATVYEENFDEIVGAISDTLRWIGVESS